MKLIKYEDIQGSFNEMDHWLDRAFRGTCVAYRNAGIFNGSILPTTTMSYRSDIYDDKDNFYVVAELPGVNKEDVKIELENAVLTVSGERKNLNGKAEHSYKFSRSMTISDNVNGEKVSAIMQDGLLTITLPKAEARKPKSISVS